MEISFVRIYLLCGLLAHKALWEFMKVRDSRPAEKKVRSLKVRVLSGIKLVILLAILAQTVTPAFLPIANAPASLRTVGLVCFTLGLLTAIVGRVQLGRNWSDIEKSYVKRDHALVVHGLYRYIRHPIYAGDLLLLLGLEMALNSWCFLGADCVGALCPPTGYPRGTQPARVAAWVRSILQPDRPLRSLRSRLGGTALWASGNIIRKMPTKAYARSCSALPALSADG